MATVAGVGVLECFLTKARCRSSVLGTKVAIVTSGNCDGDRGDNKACCFY